MDSLEKLKSEHNKLHTAIEKVLDENPIDEPKLSAMKKHKLCLEDKITNIEKNQELTNTI